MTDAAVDPVVIRVCFWLARHFRRGPWTAGHERIRVYLTRSQITLRGQHHPVQFSLLESDDRRLVFYTTVEHRQSRGYCGVTQHRIMATKTLHDRRATLRVRGRDRNQIRHHLAESFDGWLYSTISRHLLRQIFDGTVELIHDRP